GLIGLVRRDPGLVAALVAALGRRVRLLPAVVGLRGLRRGLGLCGVVAVLGHRLEHRVLGRVLLGLGHLAARGLLFAAAVSSAATAAALAATRAARLALAARRSRPGAGADDRIGVHVQSATVAVLAGGGEDLD